MAAFLVALLVFVCLCNGAVHGDHSDAVVQSLPGWSGPLPSKHYSGYVDIDSGRMHYVFVESENNCPSQQDQVPLVLWVQGGPGCSSLLGYFTEVGTFQVMPTNDSSLRLELNAHRWSKCAHMLYWESPVGVGFSYSPSKHYKTNDSHVADMNLQFLVNWFKEFPEYANLDFYIAGESYAGIYIPMVASRVKDNGNINLKGIMVGNGCIGNQVGACSDTYELGFAMPYLYTHGFVSDSAYKRVQTQCAGSLRPSGEACVAAINAAYGSVGPINVYNVLGSCQLANSSTSSGSRLLRTHSHVGDGIRGLPDCLVGQYAQAYLQNSGVQKALHIVHDTELAPWTACSDTLHAYYGETVPSILNDYTHILGSYRVLIYNGDADCRIPFTDNKQWTEQMVEKWGLSTVSKWQPWLTDDAQVGGYLTKYSKDFSFITVRGAGHMVPQFKPQAAFEMFQRFLTNTL
ncbi:uncharacterized protein LOC135819544 [Sycon ciliatum]|uniref:uncharacterized protein LOC135819544 n=1 Tax=Sycon ciliatum TaxID=27933 RepID=UPI0031F64326